MKRLISLVCLLGFLFIGFTVHAQQQVSPSHLSVNVTTASTAVVSSTAFFRKLLILINDSDTIIYCNLAGGIAVANQGVRLNASGGSIVLDAAVPKGKVNCIHGGTGNKVILVTTG